MTVKLSSIWGVSQGLHTHFSVSHFGAEPCKCIRNLIPPLLPGFPRGVCSSGGEHCGSRNPIGSARCGAIGDHTQRTRRDTICCFLCCWVSLRLVRSPEIKKDRSKRKMVRHGINKTLAQKKERHRSNENLLAQILFVGLLILSS